MIYATRMHQISCVIWQTNVSFVIRCTSYCWFTDLSICSLVDIMFEAFPTPFLSQPLHPPKAWKQTELWFQQADS